MSGGGIDTDAVIWLTVLIRSRCGGGGVAARGINKGGGVVEKCVLLLDPKLQPSCSLTNDNSVGASSSYVDATVRVSVRRSLPIDYIQYGDFLRWTSFDEDGLW